MTGIDAQRVWVEEQLLRDIGPFDAIPDVAYSYACRRSVSELWTTDYRTASMTDLLHTATIDLSIKKWIRRDPEMKNWRDHTQS